MAVGRLPDAGGAEDDEGGCSFTGRDPVTPVPWVMGLAVAAPVAGQIWATIALMNEADEFVRARAALKRVLAVAAVDAIVAAVADQSVSAARPDNRVLAAGAVDPVVAGAPVQRV